MKSKKMMSTGLTFGALGVVFGDIGTSPLYALQACFALTHITVTHEAIFGIISMIVWAVTLVVSIKYVLLIMRADNDGEGGILALLALLRKKIGHKKSMHFFVLLGLLGLALFYGDSVITPAISVLSAVEGLKIVAPSIEYLIVPITVVILLVLFSVQSRGTGKIGAVFGPIMMAWFVMSGLVGLWHISKMPSVLMALSPLTALDFAVRHPVVAFVALGAVVLSITGAEALYADMGHFGRSAVRKAWFLVVFPCLILNYLGQGALVAAQPSALTSSYFLLYPEWLQLPALIIATCATVIASQAVIAGAFSLTRQAVRLGFAPPMLVKHTSDEEVGQVYIGFINWVILLLVLVLVVVFRSSVNLAAAFGMAVSGTLLIDLVLFLVVARLVLGWRLVQLVPLAVGFGCIDMLFVASSLGKFVHGGWIPLAIAGAAFLLLTTWTRGIGIVSRERARREGSIDDFVKKMKNLPGVSRVPGVSIFLSGHTDHAPLAMHESVERLHELSEHVLVVTVKIHDVPRVALHDRVTVDELGSTRDGIAHVTLNYGFNEMPNVPRALENLHEDAPELQISLKNANYFISSSDIALRHDHRMLGPRKRLFMWLYRNSLSPTQYFHLPHERTIDMTSYVEL